MKAGDHVKFVKGHHAMSKELESFEGYYGTIQEIKGDRVLVQFPTEDCSEEFWIRMDRLEQ